MTHFLGLDSSTQSLSATVIDTDTSKIVLAVSVNFGKDLTQYDSPNGFLINTDPNIKHGNPLMWVDAVDLLCERIRSAGFDPASIRGISGAGQQHGSVYLKEPISEAPAWNATEPLAEQVRPLLSRPTSPIWMDSSTTQECREIAVAAGGDSVVSQITGSRAIERFTGPQIRRFHKLDPAAYEQTREIHLVSSFIASLLTGNSAPIDLGDAAGMNLLDLAQATWSDTMLRVTAPALRPKLLTPVPSATQIGMVSDYFVEKYGFRAGTPVIAFSGDNPSSLIGMGASRPGVVVISLGTSDTVFAAMTEARVDPRGYGHVFGNPRGGFMSLICFTNASLAREEIAKKFNLSWQAFAAAIIEKTPPGNDFCFMLPYFTPENTPKVLKPNPRYFGTERYVNQRDAAAAARAIVESQAITMRLHSDWIGQKPDALLVTGGASQNPGILRVLADVFQAELGTLSIANSSALGAALRAAHTVEGRSFDELARAFAAPEPGSLVRPNPDVRGVYDDLADRFRERLDEFLAEIDTEEASDGRK